MIISLTKKELTALLCLFSTLTNEKAENIVVGSDCTALDLLNVFTRLMDLDLKSNRLAP